MFTSNLRRGNELENSIEYYLFQIDVQSEENEKEEARFILVDDRLNYENVLETIEWAVNRRSGTVICIEPQLRAS